MKLYNSLGPNPRMVRMFLNEKGIEVGLEEIDLMGGENRRAPYTDKNPGGQLPALELDDGTVIAETTAICEYIEENNPSPALVGTTPEERAETRMWTRRLDSAICEPMGNGFRFSEGLAIFQERLRCIPQAADDLKAVAQDGIQWLDALMAGKQFICGDRLTMADVRLYAFVDFGACVGQPIPAECSNLQAWIARMNERPSAETSLHPAAAATGMRG